MRSGPTTHRAPVIGARTLRAVRSTMTGARRALFTMRPTWQPLAAAVLVVTPTAAAVATWATLPATGPGLHLPATARVEAASVDASDSQLLTDAATPTADPRLQDGYTIEPRDVQPSAPAAEAEAAPAGEPLPVWLPPTVARWEPNIRAATSRHAVDPALVAIVMTVESAGNPQAGSHAGAQGLMQVVPRWHPRILEGGGPFDPDHNLDVATAFLAELLRTYAVAGDEADGWQRTVERAAAAYNGGPGGVTNPVAETRSYVRWVGGMWRERRDDDSPTYRDWLAAGGQVAVDIAGTRPGPSGPPVGLPHLEAMR